MHSSKVYLIILNWNGYNDTCECLDSLQRLTFEHLQIVVVDNASSDNSLDSIETWAKRNNFETLRLDRASAGKYSGKLFSSSEQTIVLIQTGKNLGFAGGNNVGIRYALQMGAEYIWLLNNDTLVDSGCVEPLLESMDSDDKIGIAGSCVIYYDKPNVIQTAGMKLSLHNLKISHLGRGKLMTDSSISQQREVDCVPACSMLVRSKLISDVGLMDEEYFMYHEDVDWQIRAKRAGWKIVYVPGSKILHKCGGSTKKSRFVSAYYQSRNKFLLIAKNEGKIAVFLMIPLVFAFIRNVIISLFTGDLMSARGIWQGGKDFFLGRTGVRNFEKCNSN